MKEPAAAGSRRSESESHESEAEADVLVLKRAARWTSGGDEPASKVAAPFLKWAGGKRSVLPAILPITNRKIDTYYEPFVGGGAVFFGLLAQGSAKAPPFRRAVLSDTNAELIGCYETIRSDVEGVLAALGKHQDGEAYFYKVRDQSPGRLSPATRAARMIYLNRNGFNGLYRVNSSGRFNVPFGKYDAVRTVPAERLRAASTALREVTLQVRDFEECVADAGPGDFVYFDPPYVPVSASAFFTAYGAGGFGDAEQQRLAATLRRLGKARVPALLSNSDCPRTRALYEGLPIQALRVARAINSVATKRGHVGELLVRSFGFRDQPSPAAC